MSYTTHRLNLPVLAEIRKRNFNHTFFSDREGWSILHKTTSFYDGYKMATALLKGNLDVLKAARGKDILYLASPFAFYYSLLAMLLFRLFGRRVVYHFHELSASKSFSLKWASVFITDFVHNTKRSYEVSLAANSFIAKKRNSIIPCPINEQKFDSTHDSTEQVMPENKKHILFVGRISKDKGVAVLVRALEVLPSWHDKIVLHVVGDTSEVEYKKEFEELVSKVPYEVKKWGYRDDIQNFLRSAYLHVQPTLPSLCHESFGISTAEAMFMGVPTICFRSGALQDLVVHSQTGWVCSEESHECLAEAIKTFLDSPAMREDCSRRSVERFEREYKAARVKQLWLNLLCS